MRVRKISRRNLLGEKMTINLTQKFVFETDDIDSMRKVLETMVQVMYKGEPSEYAQLYITKRKDMVFRDGRDWKKKNAKPLYFHVCTIGDYKSRIREGDETFEDFPNLISMAIKYLRVADRNKFGEICGSGYSGFFNSMDGSVKVGYRLSHRPSGAWSNLDLSLCHIYYGK